MERAGPVDDGLPSGQVPEATLWHVTLVMAGRRVDPEALHAGLERLQGEQPFLASARYGSDRVEIRYWDEAENVDDAAAMALRIWPEHRASAGLPDWHVVGLEVLDRETLHERSERGLVPSALVLGEVRPL
ncbi:MAG: hypothetical protein ACLGIA_14135 [Actinomycetes bacterium]